VPEWNQFSTSIPISKGSRRNSEELCRFLYGQVIAKIRHDLKKFSKVVKPYKILDTLCQGNSCRSEKKCAVPDQAEYDLSL
jgi:hypothetical protein